MNTITKQSKKRILYPLLSAAVLLVGSLCFCSARWFVTTYGRTGFDSILYTLQSSLSGVQSGLLWKYILQGALPAVVFPAVLVALLYHFPHRRGRYQADTPSQKLPASPPTAEPT